MKRSRRIQPVSNIADRAEKKAALKLARNRNQLKELQTKLDIMKNYRKDYERTRSDLHSRVTATALQQNQAFLSQLDDAISILQKQVESQSELTKAEQHRWIDTWKHMNSMNKAVENLQSHENRQEERREQGLLDEHAQNSN